MTTTKRYATRSLAALAAPLALTIWTASQAQEGFPLDGTWRGQWGSQGDGTQVVITMDWDGESITGMINPGPKSIAFSTATLDPSDWTVRIEAKAGSTPIVIEGKLQEIGSYRRYIEGTWTEGGAEHEFKITRE